MNSSDVVVRLVGASVARDGTVLAGPVDWEVRAGERWVVLGRNGSGKTTLLDLVAASERPSEGLVEVLGSRVGRTDLRKIRAKVGLAGSAVKRRLAPGLSAEQVVLTGLDSSYAPWWTVYDDAARRRARILLEQAGIADRADQGWYTLSEGQRQQVLISRALMGDPALLVLDEPAATLDLPSREQLVWRLTALGESHPDLAIVMVTHHLEEIPSSFTHALLLNRGCRIAAGFLAETLTSANLEECFDLALEVSERHGRWAAVAPVPVQGDR